MGYVYILVNESMPGIVKIGSTDRTPDDRLAELSAPTGVPTPFTLAFAAFVRNHTAVEARLHQDLAGSRLNQSREFFRTATSVAIDHLEEHLLEELLTQIDALREPLRARLLEKLQHRFKRWSK